MPKKAFSLIELLIVIIIIGILAILLIPGFRPARESAANNEARANLKLIQAAEKIYRMEYGVYLISNDETYVNNMLKIALPNPLVSKWDYGIVDVGGTGGTVGFNATAVRVDPQGYDRTLSIDATTAEPGCTGTFCK